MSDLTDIEFPEHFDWQAWVARWDRMQSRYLVKRSERFEAIVSLIKATQDSPARILDLGCGTGSLMLSVLEAFPAAQVVGVDFDPTMLWLARARLESYADRSRVMLLDLRELSWAKEITTPVDAVVSATALHWLKPAHLSELYRQLAAIIRPGGIFLNADHVGSACPEIQGSWESHRDEMRLQEANSESDDWNGFWSAYSEALGIDIREFSRRIKGGWEEEVEDGLPLAWHLDRLRSNGFEHVDCFWRCDCDAIYGGIRSVGCGQGSLS